MRLFLQFMKWQMTKGKSSTIFQIFRFKKNPLFVVCYPLSFIIFAKLLIVRVVLSIL